MISDIASNAVEAFRRGGLIELRDHLEIHKSLGHKVPTSDELASAGMAIALAEITLERFEQKTKRVGSLKDDALRRGYCTVERLDQALVEVFATRAAQHTEQGNVGVSRRMYEGLFNLVARRSLVQPAFEAKGAAMIRSHVAPRQYWRGSNYAVA